MALDVPLRAGDLAFTYSAGPAAGARAGDGVIVPFGARLLPGIVLGPGTPRPGLRPVLARVEEGPLVPPAVLALAAWTAHEYLSTVGEALAVATPWDALWHTVRLELPPDARGLSRARRGTTGPRLVSLAGAMQALRRTPELLDRLVERGSVRVHLPAARALTGEYDALTVLPAAAAALAGADAATPHDRAGAQRWPPLERPLREALEARLPGVVLAGWRRAPAYLTAIDVARAAGLTCIAAFPSIEAAETFAGLAARAGLAPVLLHAGLPPARRLAAWQAAAAAQLVVGTRAAVFAPVRDPALVIVDEEDAAGHKEERAPRYVTAAVARCRAAAGGLVLLGSTTPTVATYAAVRDGRYRLVALPGRPRLGVVDLRRRPPDAAPVSTPVLTAIRRAARTRGRAVVIVDRRGFAGGLQCGECGTVARCAACGVALRYERARRRLRCQLCGRAAGVPATCGRCGGTRLRAVGGGTERVAAALRREAVRVWRLDRDVAPRGVAAGAVLAPFVRAGGVLVATPLVLPWLETLRPQVVAFVDADRLLHRPEYRATERALALIRAVGLASGTLVLVETSDPEHPALRAAVAPTLRGFYAEELAQRAALGYPPARSLILLTITGTAAAVEAVMARLQAGAPPGVEVLGPTPAPGPRPRHQVVLKAADRDAARALVLPLLAGGAPRTAQIAADVDPHEL
ncbi:MAG: primosomal protein N' [Armatimonadota bacterium]|nr:primosomal protein N' [Armatimonadota bacterium]MDR7536044.1 primosomal protein N' [Armatimonadota bacterium]